MAAKSEEDAGAEGLLVVYGSPLLEIVVNHPSATALLDKYGLQPDNSIFGEEKHLPLYAELEEQWGDRVNHDVGGAALNVARTVEWLSPKPRGTVFFGGIGNDVYGQTLRRLLQGTTVKAMLHVTHSQPTGTCITICTGDNRSMVSRMAGAGCFTEAELHLPHHWTLVDNAQFFYTVSYNLANNPAVLFTLARHAMERRKTFCLNLSAPFLCRRYKESMSSLLPFVHYLFGNQSELDEFGKVHGFQGARREVAMRVAGWPLTDQHRSRVVIITQGSDPVLVATEDKVTEYPVPTVEDIVDTTGAGDAFVGGFLTELIRHQPMAKCIDSALYASSVVLRNSGVAFHNTSDRQPSGHRKDTDSGPV